jgi:hypothetical protein
MVKNAEGDPCPTCGGKMDRNILLRWDRCHECNYCQDMFTKAPVSQAIVDFRGNCSRVRRPQRKQL